MWPLAKVRPYDKNPRAISDAAVAKVAASIREFGFQQAIVVDTDGVIIAGHTRLKAAASLGLKLVPVKVAEGLPPDKVSALRLADNRTHQEASWAQDLLKDELEALMAMDFDLALTGFNESELDAIMNGWASDFNPVERDGENLDGIKQTIKVQVEQDSADRAREVIKDALAGVGIVFELA